MRLPVRRMAALPLCGSTLQQVEILQEPESGPIGRAAAIGRSLRRTGGSAVP